MNNPAIFRVEKIAEAFWSELEAGKTLAEAAESITDRNAQLLLDEMYSSGWFVGGSDKWKHSPRGAYQELVFAATETMVDYVTKLHKIYPALKINEDINITMDHSQRFDSNLPGVEVYVVKVYYPAWGFELPKKGE